jgi:DNA-binding transcriptional LysR family regulator
MAKLARKVTLRQLQIFEVIVRLHSFTRAAAELHLTQPTVSTQLKLLADAVGLPLIEHVGKEFYLTTTGKELYAVAQDILRALEHIEMKVADLQGLKAGTLRLAVISTAKYFAPEVLGRFAKKYPLVDVAIHIANRDSVLQRLAANQDDLYIIGEPPTNLSMEAHAFADNPLFVMAHRQHPLVKERRIPLARLAEEPFITREYGSGIRAAVEHLFGEHGLRPKVRMELSSNEAIKHAITGELGISVLSLHSILQEGVRGPIALLDVEGFPIRRQWYVAYPRGKALSVVAREFLGFLTEQGKQISAQLEQYLAQLQRAGRKPAGKSAR